MNKQTLPNVICVATEERARNYMFLPEYKNEFNPNLTIVGLPDFEQLRQQGYKFPRILDVGMLLMENPFEPKSYIDINTSEQELFARKMDALTNIARYLGAKEFYCESQLDEIKKRDIKVNANGNYETVIAEGEFKKQCEEKCKQQYTRTNKWSGVTAPGDYDRAVELVKTYRLEGHREIINLLDQRRPNSPNVITQFEESITISNERNSAIAIACSIGVMGGVFNLKSETVTTLLYQTTVSLNVKIIF